MLGSSLFYVGMRQAGISALNSFHPEKDVQWSVQIRLQSPKEDVFRAKGIMLFHLYIPSPHYRNRDLGTVLALNYPAR